MHALGFIPPAQVTLDAHSAVRRKNEAANGAVFEAMRTTAVDFEDPVAAQLFGASMEVLRSLANVPRPQILPVLNSVVPIFGLRLATPEATALLATNDWSVDDIFKCVLNTFSEPVPLTRLLGGAGDEGFIPAAQAVLDVNKAVRSKIEAANLCVYEAVKALADDYDDPVAANIFSGDIEALRLITRIPRRRILTILQTAVPIFSLRLNSVEAVALVAEGKGWSDDALFSEVLKSFKDSVPLTSF